MDIYIADKLQCISACLYSISSVAVMSTHCYDPVQCGTLLIFNADEHEHCCQLKDSCAQNADCPCSGHDRLVCLPLRQQTLVSPGLYGSVQVVVTIETKSSQYRGIIKSGTVSCKISFVTELIMRKVLSTAGAAISNATCTVYIANSTPAVSLFSHGKLLSLGPCTTARVVLSFCEHGLVLQKGACCILTMAAATLKCITEAQHGVRCNVSSKMLLQH